MAFGLYARKSANFKVRRFFWLSLVLGLVASAMALGILGEWWLMLGPSIPLTLILLLRLKFPFIFGVMEKNTSGNEEDSPPASAYNDGHEDIDEEKIATKRNGPP